MSRIRTEEQMHFALHERMLCGGCGGPPQGTAPTQGCSTLNT
jgi:hypothetical protein